MNLKDKSWSARVHLYLLNDPKMLPLQFFVLSHKTCCHILEGRKIVLWESNFV